MNYEGGGFRGYEVNEARTSLLGAPPGTRNEAARPNLFAPRHYDAGPPQGMYQNSRGTRRGQSGNRRQRGGSRGKNRGHDWSTRGGRLGSLDSFFPRNQSGDAHSDNVLNNLMDLRIDFDAQHPRRGRGRGRSQHPRAPRRGRSRGDQSPRGNRNEATANEPVRKRLYPVGFDALMDWTNKPPDIVIHSLLDKMSGVPELLANDKIPDDKMVLFVKALAIATTCTSCRQALNEVFSLVFTLDFVSKLVMFQMSLMNCKRNDMMSYWRDQLQLLKAFTRVHPAQARELLPALLQSVELVLEKSIREHEDSAESQSEKEELSVIKNEYERLSTLLTADHKGNDRKLPQKPSFQQRLAQIDDMEPDDDYRDLPVEPTSYELSKVQPPVIRRNITQGAYKDVHNYLDVQFRLLREDFIRPLREGVCHVRSGERSSKDVRVYHKVTFQEAEVIRGVLIHFVKLQLPKNFKVESSKRLLFGNVMCFSADNFSSYFLATVAGANPEKLREGVVGVKLLSQPKIDSSCFYTAVESRAFFVSYKHVLKALQNLDEDTLPLAEHIVFAQPAIDAPEYLLNSRVTHYDLRVVLKTSYMKDDPEPNELFREAKTEEPPAGLDHLQTVPILNAGIETWPASAELGLDQSQRNALHAALTKRLVVIQGPPGTGKTFLGLKITQVLLHNSKAWSRKESEIRLAEDPEYHRQTMSVDVEVKSPILVLCYTNHALDQFLEGMLNFTHKIIRIGSRSKSENIQQFQINEYLRNLKGLKLIPTDVYHAGTHVREKVSYAEMEVKRRFAELQEIRANKGLVSWNLLTTHGVIPSTIASQLKNSAVYRSWILPVDQPQCVNEYVYDGREVWSAPVKENDGGKASTSRPKEDDEEWHDALEMLRAAESERIVEVEDEEFDNLASGSSCIKIYDVELLDHAEYQNYLYDNLRQNNFTEEEVRMRWRSFFVEQNYLAKLVDFSKEKDVTAVSSATIKENVDIFDLAFADRCLLYATWRHNLLVKMRENIRPEEVKLQTLLARAQEVKNSEYLYVARQADVVGLTTTGAAQFQAVVQELKPKIVIIEEAAEILEAHVVASLNSTCEHLIMIGDHQQLKPSPAVYQLAKSYGLDTSLFERMINNGLEYQTLEYQHRMRPEISSLLVPAIYEHLKDHQSVHGRPHIRGVHKSVFFISHKEMEIPESDDNNSHSNVHEATFIMRLARHLVLQGYSTEQITVLTPYSGQFFLLKKEQRKYGPTCEGMRISIVDNFQGEENDIILLSLVRSNESGNVGFLKIENRVCVALSRAKLGFFIIGNMDQLRQSSDLWVKISESLKANDGLGDALVLCCSNHPDEKAAVKTEEDLRLKSPEGGCTLPCSVSFPRCGHPCPRVCHPDDPAHIEGKCREPCARKCAEEGHPCPALCFELCPVCTVKVERKLPCGHSHLVPCHVSIDNFKCPSKVEKVIDACGHSVEMACHLDPKKVKCPVQCDVRLDCGHACSQLCHAKNDPEHVKYICQSPCTRNMKGCSEDHKCTLLCYQKCLDCTVKVEKKLPCGHKAQLPCQDSVEGFRCNQNCRKSLECGHHCPRRCWAPCGGCQVKISKTITACGHEIQMECSKTPVREMCESKTCSKRMPCEHKCPRPCREPCGGCQEVVSSGVVCQGGGHELLVPCSSLPMAQPDFSLCRAPCQVKLQCEHQCKGTCGACFHGRFHLPCAQKCERVLVCGHVCKSPCSAACPPCQDKCRWRCSHSRCSKNCGVKCVPCQERCSYKCDHKTVSCTKKCGEECDCKPCEEPCLKLLKCGHPCVGLCGDPCPPLCRICDKQRLTEFLFGTEDDPDARFVLMEDCGHVIEYESLKYWLMQPNKNNQVQMKRCPSCSESIYNNRRFKNLVLQTYKDVQKVLFKHDKQKLPTLHQIVLQCTNDEVRDDVVVKVLDKSLFFLDCIAKSQLVKYIEDYFEARTATAKDAKHAKIQPRRKEFKLGAEKLQLFSFQVDVIKTAKKIDKDLDAEFKADLSKVMERVMSQAVCVSDQFRTEVACELSRIGASGAVAKIAARTQGSAEAQQLLQRVRQLMDPRQTYTKERDERVQRLFTECQKYYSGVGISLQERLEIKKALNFAGSGHWYKCPRGHVYAIGNCGLANQESVCPEEGCGARIGGTGYQLDSANSLASEMD